MVPCKSVVMVLLALPAGPVAVHVAVVSSMGAGAPAVKSYRTVAWLLQAVVVSSTVVGCPAEKSKRAASPASASAEEGRRNANAISRYFIYQETTGVVSMKNQLLFPSLGLAYHPRKKSTPD